MAAPAISPMNTQALYYFGVKCTVNITPSRNTLFLLTIWGSGLTKMAVSASLNLLHLPLYLKHISHFRCKSQFHALDNFMLYVG